MLYIAARCLLIKGSCLQAKDAKAADVAAQKAAKAVGKASQRDSAVQATVVRGSGSSFSAFSFSRRSRCGTSIKPAQTCHYGPSLSASPLTPDREVTRFQ